MTDSFVRRYFGPAGSLRRVTAPLHRAVIAQELFLERLADSLGSPAPSDEAVLQDLTVLVKTFERPHIVRRLVSSIKKLYPGLEVLVVDDSRNPVQIEGVKTIVMPFDSGISAGRNEGLRHVTARYVLVLDDDIVFCRRTRLQPALSLMAQHPQIDIMGGRLIDLPFYRTRSYGDGRAAIFRTEARPVVPIGSSIGGLQVCAKVPNFFLARRDRLVLVPWDAQLKRVEHADFFTRALGVLTTVFNPDIVGLHARTPFDVEYMGSRLSMTAESELLEERYGQS